MKFKNKRFKGRAIWTNMLVSGLYIEAKMKQINKKNQNQNNRSQPKFPDTGKQLSILLCSHLKC